MTQKDMKDVLEGLSDIFQEVKKSWETDAEEYWNSLDQEQKMLAFFSVIKRLHKGEIEEGRSYRGVLYDIFGFGPEAYAMGMFCGFMDIHNAIPLKDK
jgi:predicted RNA-binding protein with EMAP domain